MAAVAEGGRGRHERRGDGGLGARLGLFEAGDLPLGEGGRAERERAVPSGGGV